MTKSGLSSLLPASQLSSVRQVIAGTLTLMSARDSLATQRAYADVPPAGASPEEATEVSEG